MTFFSLQSDSSDTTDIETMSELSLWNAYKFDKGYTTKTPVPNIFNFNSSFLISSFLIFHFFHNFAVRYEIRF